MHLVINMAQIIEQKGFMNYTSSMKLPSQEEIRKGVSEFIQRKGHGSIKLLAKRSGLSRQTVTRFHGGEKVDDTSLLRFKAVIEPEKVVSESIEERQAKNRDMLRGVLAKNPRAIIAAKLYSAADTLMAHDLFDDDSAFNGLMDTVKYLFENKDAILAAIRKAGKSSE